MDPDDFDQTQAIALDDDDNDDTDDLEPDGQKQPVSFLKVLLQKGLNETSYPIYEGDNIIGRNKDTCHVFIQSKSLSKEHACVQVVGDVHMIFDKGSRNKTRRGKLFLSPDVRYELKNNEEVTFADVRCVYQIADKIDTVAESGSETDGSESLMLKYDVTDEAQIEAAQKKEQSNQDVSKNNNDDSVLPPTQSYAQDQSKSKVIVKDTPESTKAVSRSLVTEVPMATLVLSESESSDEEGDSKGLGVKSVKQTSSKTSAEVQDTLLCEDSDPESSRDKCHFGAATQAYGLDHEDESSLHSLIGAATQAYRPAGDDSDEDAETDSKIMTEPTQAFVKSDHVSEDLQDNVGTQSFKVEGKVPTPGQKKNEPKELSASDSSAAATQVFEEEEDGDDFNGAGLFAASTMACDDVVEEDETEDEDGGGESDLIGPDAATQVFAEAPTQKIKVKEKKETQADTMAVSSSCDAATLPVPSNNTSQRSSRSKSQINHGGTEDISTTDLPTQVITEEGETLPIKEIVTGDKLDADTDAETQVFIEETVAVEDVVKTRKGKQKQTKAGKETEIETLPVEDSRNLPNTRTSKRSKTSAKNVNPKTGPISDTLVFGEEDDTKDGGRDDPTQLFDTDNGQEKEIERENCGNADDPTQDFANSSSDLPTQVFSPDDTEDTPGKGNKQKPARKLAASKESKDLEVVFSEDDEDDNETGEKPWLAATANEPTQAFVNNEETDARRMPTGKKAIVKNSTLALSDENSDDDVEPEKVTCENDPTQAYGDLDDEEVEDVATDDVEVKAVGAEEPTQAYCLVGEESSDEDDSDVKKADEPTQAYALEPDEQSNDGDADATQPFENDMEEEDNTMQENAQNQGPTQKYDMALEEAPKIIQRNEREETMEDSGDDSDLEETSVLQVDQVAEALVESPQLSTSVDEVRKTIQGIPNKEKPTLDVTVTESKLQDEQTKISLEPPLSPEIPDKSNESTPVFSVFADKKELSDTEEMVPDSMANSDGEEKTETESNPIIPLSLPNKSPLKSALVDRRRSPSPARKRVNFTEPELSRITIIAEEASTGPGRGRRSQTKKVEQNIARGRVTRKIKNDFKGEHASSKDQKKEDSEVETTDNQGKGQSSKGNVNVDENSKQGVGKDKGASEKAEASSANVDGARLPSRSSRGRKRKVNEDSQKVSEDNESDPVPTKSSRNVDSKKWEQTVTPEQNVGNVEENKEGATLGLTTKKVPTSKKTDQITNSLVNQNKEKEKEKLENKSPAQDTKASSTCTVDDNLTSTPEGRTSSRGRRITTSNHLKDYDTGTKPKGRVSRSSVRSSSPAVNAKPSDVTAQDSENSDTHLQSSTMNNKFVGSAAKQVQSPAFQDLAPSEENKKMVSTSGAGTSRRGGRGKVDVKESPDGAKTDPGNVEKYTNVDNGAETKANSARKGANSRLCGNKSTGKTKSNVIEGSTADIEAVRGDSNDSASTVANESKLAVKTSPKKTRGQVLVSVPDESKAEDKTAEDNLNEKESVKIEKSNTHTDSVTGQRKRGRKSIQSLQGEADTKKTKITDDIEESEEVEETEKVSGASRSGKGRGRPKAVGKPDKQQKQTLASAGTEEEATGAEPQRSRRGRPTKAVVTSKIEEESPQENKTIEKEETENAPTSASTTTRGQGKGRRSVAALTNLSGDKQENKSLNEHGKDSSECNQNATSRVSSRQKSKASIACEEETKGQEKLSNSATAVSGKADQNPQSSMGSKGRKGTKRSNQSQDSQSEENSHSQAYSSAGESQLLTHEKKQAGKNSKKSNSEGQKETNKTQSQPSPSPLKKSRRSSPSPSTPSRKGVTAVASPISSPSLRKSTQNHQPKVMFTGVIDDQGEKIVKELGGELVSNIQECTHLITDKVRRTVKFLGGLAKGALIVTPHWLESSKRARTFLDGNKFLVNDPAMEKQYHFSLHSSIERASSTPLLQGYGVHVTPSVKPDPTQMKDILHCAGAKFLSNMPVKSQPQTVVISCPEDQALWTAAAKAGVPVMGAEFILTGLLRQELQPQVFSLIKTDTPQKGKGRGRHK